MASRVPKLHHKRKKLNSLYYLKKAKQAYSQDNYVEAYESFVNYFESLEDPSLSSETVQTAFTEVVCKIGTVLEETDNVEELLKCYLQAINFFPNNYVVLNTLGAYMFKVGEIDIAKKYLKLATGTNKEYLPAEKNLMHIKWHEIPRWHFRMLNDRVRNEAYNKAINDIVNQGYYNVMDIGSGCGLLSLFAARNPMVEVLAIEENRMLYKMCSKILKENKVENVQCLNALSVDLENAMCKCNLIVTEIFDVALFGERAAESILHALTVLCTEMEHVIVPFKAKLYVTGVGGAELGKKNWFIPDSVTKALGIPLDFGTAFIKQQTTEPYEAEDLSEIKVRYMTNTQEVYHVNFYNTEQLRAMIGNEDHHRVIRLSCEIGEKPIFALAVWFDLHLTEDVKITTNPREDGNRVKCWEQAIFYLDQPVVLSQGGTLNVNVTMNNCKLNFRTSGGCLVQQGSIEVSREMISFLNDKNLMFAIAKVASEFIDPGIVVVDCNVFPLFGLILAKNNNATVYHKPKNANDKKFINQIRSRSRIPISRLIFLDSDADFMPKVEPHQLCVYFYDSINVDGSLENILFEEPNIPELVKIPETIVLKVQVIYSEYIERCNRVKDENVLGFKIAKFMNEYSGDEHPNIENLDYTEYSAPVSFTLNGDNEQTCEVYIKKTGMINGLYFWYELHFHSITDIIFSTLNSTYYKKSCFLLGDPRPVMSGDLHKITMKTEENLLKLSFE